jgi:hypothetical protein
LRREAEEGEKENWGSALAGAIQRNTPRSTLWYTRLLANRFLFDNIRKQIDPDYASSFARQKERAQKLHGQKFCWEPGQGSPQRFPDLGAAVR